MPEVIEKSEEQNKKIADRLADTDDVETRTDAAYEEAKASVLASKEVFPNSLDTMSAGEVAETLTAMKDTGVVQQHIKEAVAKKTRGPKTVAKVTGKVSAEEVVTKLKEQANKAEVLMSLVVWIDEAIKPQDIPANLSKEHRELLLGYVKELEASKSKVLDHISKL